LNQGAFAYDFIWWGFDKAHQINLRGIAEQVVFAVDDEEQFVNQYASVGIRTYWMLRPGHAPTVSYGCASVVTSLQEIMAKENDYAETD
jgi:hypothetical protein